MAESEDRLDRVRLAKLMAEEIATAPVESGFVTAITGPWGEGKTSLLNLIEGDLRERGDCKVVKFNPWLFSNAEALVGRFFAELGAELQGQPAMEKVSDGLLAYGRALLPFSAALGPFGPVAAMGISAASGIREHRKKLKPSDLKDKKAALEEGLREARQRIVVMVDDMDRLQHDEIRDVIRLVKLVGDLPYVTFVLAFEQARVARALGDDRVGPDFEADGNEYLAKVVQLMHVIPAVPPSSLEAVLVEDLNESIDGLPQRSLNEIRWHQVLGLGIRLLIRNIRDVRRYTNSVPAMLKLMREEIALEDLLALVALRLFEPRVHAALGPSVELLTGSDRFLRIFATDEADEERKRRIEDLIKRSERSEEATRNLLAILFPAVAEAVGQTPVRTAPTDAERNRNVADPSVLRAYLHIALDEDVVPVELVEEVVRRLDDEEYLQQTLDGLSGHQKLNLMDRLIHEAEHAPADRESAIRIFLGLEPSLPPRVGKGIFALPSDWTVRQVVRALLPSEGSEQLLDRLYESVPTNTERCYLLYWFGTFPERGDNRSPDNEIWDETRTGELAGDLTQRILDQDPGQLAGETGLVQLLMHVREQEGGAEKVRALLDDDAVLLRLVRESVPTVTTMSPDGFPIDQGPEVRGDTLRALLQPDVIRERLKSLEGLDLDEQDRQIIEKARAWADQFPSSTP